VNVTTHANVSLFRTILASGIPDAKDKILFMKWNKAQLAGPDPALFAGRPDEPASDPAVATA
jgi:hypothetical protein